MACKKYIIQWFMVWKHRKIVRLILNHFVRRFFSVPFSHSVPRQTTDVEFCKCFLVYLFFCFGFLQFFWFGAFQVLLCKLFSSLFRNILTSARLFCCEGLLFRFNTLHFSLHYLMAPSCKMNRGSTFFHKRSPHISPKEAGRKLTSKFELRAKLSK